VAATPFDDLKRGTLVIVNNTHHRNAGEHFGALAGRPVPNCALSGRQSPSDQMELSQPVAVFHARLPA